MLPVISAVEPLPQEAPASSTTVASIALRLDGLIQDVAKANGHNSEATTKALESLGLSTALSFVMPLTEILKRGPQSPLRNLSIFQVQALHTPKPAQQRIVLDECEEALAEGSLTPDKITSGVVMTMLSRHAAKVNRANMRTIHNTGPTRVDLQIKALELEQQLDLYERALSVAAARAGMAPDDFVVSLLKK